MCVCVDLYFYAEYMKDLDVCSPDAFTDVAIEARSACPLKQTQSVKPTTHPTVLVFS